MRTLFVCLVLLAAGSSWSAEQMTPKQFRELVGTEGDTNALRPELASLPFWRKAKCSITMKYQDGKVFKEECIQTAKTIGGKFIVFSVESQYYKQTMHAIAGYDEKASAVREWGLFGDTLTEATVIFDPEKKLSASTSRYGNGFEEISVGSSSDAEMSEHTLVYKDGMLFMIRDAKTRPIRAADKVEPDAATSQSQPDRSGTNSTSAPQIARDSALQVWRSPDSSLKQRSDAVNALFPKGASREEIDRVLGRKGVVSHYFGPTISFSGAVTNHNYWRLEYEFPGGGVSLELAPDVGFWRAAPFYAGQTVPLTNAP